jgi:hypothetical protein
VAESTTENLFREFYGAPTFIEKHDIPKDFGFQSKREGSTDGGYPDFFKDMASWLIVVETKSGRPGLRSDHAAAVADVRSYMTTNAVPHIDIVGIALSGQTLESLEVSYFFRKAGTDEIEELDEPKHLVSIADLTRRYEADAVGMPAAWHGEIDGPVCFQNTLLRYRAIEGVTTPEFVRHWCLWAYESGTFRDVAPPGVNIKHIGDRRAKAMLVGLPDIDEQVQIVDEIEPLATAVTSLREEAARLTTARAALLDAFLNREVDVWMGTNLEDEALEDLAPI